jgi:hypothetical protein
MSTNPPPFLTKLTPEQLREVEAHFKRKFKRAQQRIISVGGKRYEVLPAKRIAVVRISLDATSGEGSTSFESADDLLLQHVTAWSEDVTGLGGVRIGWTNDAGQNEDFYAAKKDDDVIYPVASTLFTDANTSKLALEPWDLVFRKGVARKFTAQNVSGTPAYDVELTLQLRKLRLVD